jgi:hypothetical protein
MLFKYLSVLDRTNNEIFTQWTHVSGGGGIGAVRRDQEQMVGKSQQDR